MIVLITIIIGVLFILFQKYINRLSNKMDQDSGQQKDSGMYIYL